MEILNYLSIPSVENITKLLSHNRQSKSTQPNVEGGGGTIEACQAVNKNIAIFLDIVMFLDICQLFKIWNFL
jgi:hypothetical protein